MPISKRVSEYLKQGSWIRRLFEEGAKLQNDGSGLPVYDFSIGNPDLEPPKEFNSTLKKIIQNPTLGSHKYMANTGYLETRDAVANSLKKEYSIDFSANNIIMTVGAGGALNTILKTITDIGEEIIVPTPYFVEYAFYTENHGAKLVPVKSAQNFDLDINSIKNAITDKTRAVIITNPNNPTGFLYPQESLNKLGNMLRRKSEKLIRPIFLIDDAPYRKLVYDVSMCTSSFVAYENTIMGTSHSKDLGLPGERIGYIAISPKINNWELLSDGCAFANRTLGFVNAPALMQRVVTKLQDVTIDLDWYRRKRDRLYKELTRMGYNVPYPGGAFYMFPEAPGGDDMKFIDIMKKKRVLVVPGKGFGTPGYFRISYCVSDDKIEGALPAFEEAISELK